MTDKEWNHFLNQAGIYGIQGLMVAQNVAAIFFTPETVGGSDALDAALDAEEVATLTKLEQEGETEASDAGAESVTSLKEMLSNKTLTRQTNHVDNYVSESTGYSVAKDDFYNLNPSDIKIYDTEEGETMVGKLNDGATVNVRSHSSQGYPTLEVDNRPIGGKQIKVRY
ncbi:hypothetical protein [Lactococcus cremoris]|uniref:Uncharacterized protein n=1 Tax=Lactococcus lactis subsp. cremoris TaxID=1359 RepID=A0AAX4ACM9_LACLC|nr:hypothetical protein [Lactococcus cremoris]WMX70223.1 hypothetical protein RF668_10005 [Lactococcus cremoris]